MLHSHPGVVGWGYGDGQLAYICTACKLKIDKDLLNVDKFIRDTNLLVHEHRPMPGTLLHVQTGKPDLVPQGAMKGSYPITFPNRLVKTALHARLNGFIKPGYAPPNRRPTLSKIVEEINFVMSNGERRCLIDGISEVSYLYSKNHKVSFLARSGIRHMMSRYWGNFSILGLDLCGAVMRQGVFTEKMTKVWRAPIYLSRHSMPC